MFSVELYGRVRHACHVEGLSLREAARRFGIHRNTVRKMLAFAVPPGYRRRDPPARPRLGAFTAIIDRILEEDRSAPAKQRHTAKRIHERLRAEHGFAGGYTIVKDYVRERRARVREVFVPLAHPPGHAQADFGEAVAVVGGVERKVPFFCLDLPHSDAGFVKAYPAERLEAFCDGHNAAFAFFGGVPRSILYDNTRLAVARILGDGTRERTRGFAELRSHHLFLDRFGRPGKGNDKGKVEGLVGYARRNFLVPVPRADSFAALNAHLEARCRERQGARLRGHEETIGERLQRDLAALQARPAAPYEACERKAARVSAMSLVRFDRNDHSARSTSCCSAGRLCPLRLWVPGTSRPSARARRTSQRRCRPVTRPCVRREWDLDVDPRVLGGLLDAGAAGERDQVREQHPLAAGLRGVPLLPIRRGSGTVASSAGSLTCQSFCGPGGCGRRWRRRACPCRGT